MITEEEYLEVVDLYLENLKQLMLEEGGMFPHLTIFANHKKQVEDEPKTAIIHVPIPEEYMENDESKDEFIEEVMPGVYETVREKFDPYGVAWAAEAWMRVADKDFNIHEDDYRNLPIKKEVLFVSIETINKTDTFVYQIKRKGSQVNPGGSITSRIELIELKDLCSPNKVQGRFAGLYKKLNK